ncbi:WYL domain-containing protein [bacterium]|nr:WYL domain-containing protein [bacterium]
MFKKIKLSIPYYLYEILAKDIENFSFKPNGFFNTIFEQLYKESFEIGSQKSKFNKTIQFNLNKRNVQLYDTLLMNGKIDSDTEFFRSMLNAYVHYPQYYRERILFNNTFRVIEGAVKNRVKVRIVYKDVPRVIEPYFVSNVQNEAYNYIFSYCHKNGDYRNYKLSLIDSAIPLEQSQEKRDEDYIQDIEKHFDPFLSYGSSVKVKLTETGQSMLKFIDYNRPKLLSSDGDLFTFEASTFKAKIYFQGFLKEAEILEPKSLRDWFANELKKAAELYFSKK